MLTPTFFCPLLALVVLKNATSDASNPVAQTAWGKQHHIHGFDAWGMFERIKSIPSMQVALDKNRLPKALK